MKKNIKFSRNSFNQDKLKKWARSVKKRDGFICRACGYKKALHSHHILPKGKFRDYAFSLWNGITLCKICHLGECGVHGKGSPRNQIVAKLRNLMFSDSCEVKKLNDSIVAPKRKSKIRYKRYNRGKFYK